MIADYRIWRPWFAASALASLVFPASSAHAQDAPAAPAAPAPAPAAPAPTPAVPSAPETPAPTATAVPPPAPPPAAEPAKPKINYGVWFNVDSRFQNPNDPKKFDKAVSSAEVDLLFSGEVHKYIKWQANFVGTFGNPATDGGGGPVSVLDLHAKLEPTEAFNIWFGRMLVPSDRANFSGTWFASPWYYPGIYGLQAGTGVYVGPAQGPHGRNDGATVWGQFAGGMFKYYAGVFGLHDPDSTRFYSGRLNLSLLNPEPGFYHSSTYYGKDILAIGVGAQYQKDGSIGPAPMPGAPPPTADYSEFNADLLFEKNLNASGVVDVEGAFYNYGGDYRPLKYSYLALASYLIPTVVGIGKFQPLVRLQQSKVNNAAEDTWTSLEAQVGYVVDEFGAKLALGFQTIDVGGPNGKGNAIYLGVQIKQ
jgi:hypothetical protein